MRHIKDIYPLVKEVRQRIIEKMRAENIVLVQFCPATEEDYLQEHEGEKDVQEYGDYRDEHCPYVIWFDKYSSGEDLCVMSVSFMDGEHPYFVLHCEGEYDGKDVCDDDVAWLTMLNVYEMLEKHLELDGEPEKVYVFTAEQAWDGEIADTIVKTFRTREAAREFMHKFIHEDDIESIADYVKRRDWEVEMDEPDLYRAYVDGRYSTDHIEITITECNME